MKKWIPGLIMMAIGIIAIIALVLRGRPVHDIIIIWFFAGMAWSLVYSLLFIKDNNEPLARISNIVLTALPVLIGAVLVIIKADAGAYYAAAGLLILTLLIERLQKKA